MEIIGAAALIAVGIVVAAVLYGRVHGTGVRGAAPRAPGASPRRNRRSPARASRPSA